MKFYYAGFLSDDHTLISISGLYESENIQSAAAELSKNKLKITDIRPATSVDIQIERLKRKKDRLENKKSPIIPKPKVGFWKRIKKWMA